ncbi:alkene reductase [Pendulispora brunnea]|uniref:Alkene reductase n=1 Tax=Pendulispora brunnea TaxID=2905690 RepID=A0ABZ2K6X1_9BACT
MSLFSPFRLGPLQLANRVAMAPMTRSRAEGSLPNELHRDYYVQRASAGLIITEGTAPSPNALGYARIPGLFSAEHVARWRKVTEGVHAAGGKIIAQLMHVGRIAHALNLPENARVVAPSAVRAEGQMYTDQQGLQPHPTPEAMSASDLHEARDEYRSAAMRAIEAGFDGVELHGANGYLLEQFLHPHTNRRTDEYGGSVERRIRFVAETIEVTAAAIGAERLAIRLSPYSTYNDLPQHDMVEAQYLALAGKLRGLLYVHLVRAARDGFDALASDIRRAYGGPIILNAGFDAASAQSAIDAGQADMVSFGRPFIANPDLVLRMQKGAELAVPDHAKFYTPGANGYTDYPSLSV